MSAEEAEYLCFDGASIPWTASKLARGVEIKNLGKADGRAMQLVRFQPGAVFPTHVHPGPEFIFVLEGEVIQNGKRLCSGWSSISASNTVDDRFRSDTGGVFLLVYSC